MEGMTTIEHACVERAMAAPMLWQVETWANVNSGSRNLDGLATVGAMLADALSDLPGEVKFVEYGVDRVRMDVRVGDRPWLFLSDTFFPGWKARVDGAPAKIYRANHAFRALYLEPGKHAVTWDYEPTWFRAGMAVSGLTVIFFMAYYSGAGKLLRREGPDF